MGIATSPLLKFDTADGAENRLKLIED